MRLFFLQLPNLQDQLFMRQWSNQLAKGKEPCLIVYGWPESTVEEIKFAGKRLAALLNEAMVPAISCTGDQKALFSVKPTDELTFNELYLESLFRQASCVVFGVLVAFNQKYRALPPADYLKVLSKSMLFTKKHLFVRNGLSPLANPARVLTKTDEVFDLIRLFPEERTVLELALQCLPCTVSNAQNFDVY